MLNKMKNDNYDRKGELISLLAVTGLIYLVGGLLGCKALKEAYSYEPRTPEEIRQVNDMQKQSRDKAINEHYDWVRRGK